VRSSRGNSTENSIGGQGSRSPHRRCRFSTPQASRLHESVAQSSQLVAEFSDRPFFPRLKRQHRTPSGIFLCSRLGFFQKLPRVRQDCPVSSGHRFLEI